MWNLIESLVEFSRIGRKAIQLKPVDLDELVRVCVDDMRTEIEAREAAVEVRGELDQVEGDPALLKIVGLSAIRRVVEIMGGQIGVTSSLNDGSTLWIELTSGGVR
jgi:signal transduction histidine kinase